MRMRLLALAGMPLLFAACQVNTPTRPAPSGAAPAGLAASATATYDFYSCVGPAGTPSAFTAVKTAVPPQTGHPVSAAAAFRLVDNSGIFIVLSFGAGGFTPPGIEVSGNATVTCTVAIEGQVFNWSGVLTPR